MIAHAFDGLDHIEGCIGCAFANKTIDYARGIVYESDTFLVSQDYQCPIPGFLIIGSKRHVASVLDLTDGERDELTTLTYRTRLALAKAGVPTVRFFQAEDSRYHFHMWLFPHESWMDAFGKGVASLIPVWKHAVETMRTPEQVAAVQAVLTKVRAAFII